MDRLLAHDAEHLAMAADEAKTLSDEDLWIPATNRLDVGEALVVDVADDDADLIDVAGQHDRRLAAAIYFGEAVAGDVATHLREFLCVVAPHLCGRGLEAGRARRIEQLFQKAERIGSYHQDIWEFVKFCRFADWSLRAAVGS